MKTRSIQIWIGLVLLAAACLGLGCAKEEELSVENLPPQTYLAIADSVRNVTSYIQTLRWWGDDKDGEVTAFEYRWFIDPLQGSCRHDTSWVRTEATSETFDLPVSGPDMRHRFEVRAIDNDGAVDPTPCTLVLPVTNRRPAVAILNREQLPDTTLPALLTRLHGSDPDGDNTIARYIAWLDGDREHAKVLTPPDTTVSLGLDDFGGRYGVARTLTVIAVDSGCDTSDAVSYTWFVKQPTGRVLLVDDLGQKQGGAGQAVTDAFYRAGLDSCGEAYSVLDIEKFGGMLSAFNFSKLFPAFDLVIWYNEPTKLSYPASPQVSYLGAAANDLKSYVEGGGSILVASLAALGSGGSLPDSEWQEVFGIDSVVVRPSGSTNFDCQWWTIQSSISPEPDSLGVVGIFPGPECLLPSATATPLYVLPESTLVQLTPPEWNPRPYYLGVLNSWQSGKAALITFPLSRSNNYGSAPTEYCRVVDLLLH
jgi:hypothetical protein